MKKHTLRHLLLVFLCHLLAAGIAMATGDILFHTNIKVSFLDREKTYYLDPIGSNGESFTDSEIFTDIFTTEAEDVLTYLAMRRILETEYGFDISRPINITEYAQSAGASDDTNIPAWYSLDELIKWGRFGITHNTRTMGLNEFLQYYGNIFYPQNFEISAGGTASFTGYHHLEQQRTGFDPQLIVFMEENGLSAIQLQRAALDYITARVPEGTILISEEEGGIVNVTIPILVWRYNTTRGVRSLSGLCTNWVDYFALQRNLEQAITELSTDYEIYRKGKAMYSQGDTNLIYVVRMTQEDGSVLTYTNDTEYLGTTDEGLTEMFSENMEYLIYFQNNLEYSGLSDVPESALSHVLRLYSNAYPDDTRIWMYVDLDNRCETDAFYHVGTRYNEIRNNIRNSIVIAFILFLLWVGLFFYNVSETGKEYGPNGQEKYGLYLHDYIFLEFALAFCVLGILILRRGASDLSIMTEKMYSPEAVSGDISFLQSYGSYGLFGFLASLFLIGLCHTIVRRVRCGILYRQSLLYLLLRWVKEIYRRIYFHRNISLQTLLPYNLFLFSNLGLIFLIFRFWNTQRLIAAGLIVALLVLDTLVGLHLMKNQTERREIVDGIERIRNGEVNYKIDASHLSVENALLADAVNNIGDGIESAVNTSMRDEKMKSDLITNVSHDLKTPLTSIINYVDLLQRLGIEDHPAADYLHVLDEKSHRLKFLLEDLLEASKISSGNIELNMERLNLSELMNQCCGEFEENLEKRHLTLVMELTESAYVLADGRRTWRVVDNLFQNICKYAMEGTRVYVTIRSVAGKIELSIKNIAEKQSSLQGRELTERFIRGDESRSTEGSGLGLFIAKSLTEIQGGEFHISMDGDLFKATMIFPEYGMDVVAPSATGES